MIDLPTRLPPYSEEAEAATIGAILLDTERVMDLCTESGIEIEAFYVPAHKLVWRCCKWLYENKKAVDVLTVGNTLQGYGKLDEAGGGTFLDGLVERTPTAAHAKHYVEIVIADRKRRQVIAVNNAASALAYERERDVDDIVASQLHALTELSEVGHKHTALNLNDVWEESKRDAKMAREGTPVGLPSPWKGITAEYGVITMVVGNDGSRKSFLVNQWGLHAAVRLEKPYPGCYFSMEDSEKHALNRAACMLAGSSSFKWEHGRIEGEEWKAVDDAAKRILASPYEIRGMTHKTLAQRRLEIAKGVAKKGWRWICMDAFKDLDTSGSDFHEEGRLMMWLKGVAREFNLALILTHHINKSRNPRQAHKNNEVARLAEKIIKHDIRGNSRIKDDSRCIMALQCQWRNDPNHGNALRPMHYVLDNLKASYGEARSISMDVDEHTGVFVEATGVTPFSDWELPEGYKEKKDKGWYND